MRRHNMPWIYKAKRVIKEGKEWQDDEGVQHPWCWARWDEEYKRAMHLHWDDKT